MPGAMWTASHNPAQYNGLKLCRAGAEPVGIETGLAQIRDRALAGQTSPLQPPRAATARRTCWPSTPQHVRSFVRRRHPAPA